MLLSRGEFIKRKNCSFIIAYHEPITELRTDLHMLMSKLAPFNDLFENS